MKITNWLNTRLLRSLISLAVLLVFGKILHVDYKTYVALKNCELKMAKVIKIPKYCIGNNVRLFVEIKNRTYSLRMSKSDCGLYKVGDTIEIKENIEYGYVFWPLQTHKISITIIFIITFLFLFFGWVILCVDYIKHIKSPQHNEQKLPLLNKKELRKLKAEKVGTSNKTSFKNRAENL